MAIKLPVINIEQQKQQPAPATPAPKMSSSPAGVTTYSATSMTFGVNDYSIYHQPSQNTFKSATEIGNYLFSAGNGLFARGIKDGVHAVGVLAQHAGKSAEQLEKENEQGCGVWTVDLRKDTNGDGEVTEDDELVTTSLVDAIVDSFDSELDLYIEAQLERVITEYGAKAGIVNNLRCIFGSPDSEALKELARLGIRADAIGNHDDWQNRTYTFSLVDMSGLPEDATDEEIMAHVYADDAKILEDSQGNKGSIVFADCLVPDGIAQGAEINMSSVLDQMGYECISKADFIGKQSEYNQLIENIKSGLDNDLYASSGDTIQTKYGETLTISQAVCAVYNINGDAPGEWRARRITYEDMKNAVEQLGDSLYKNGKMLVGTPVENGGKNVELANYNSLVTEYFDTLEILKDSNLTPEEKEEAENKVKALKKEIDEKSVDLIKSQDENAQNANFDDAISEAQKAVDEAIANNEDVDAAIELIAKQYDIDVDLLADKLNM